MMQKKGDFIMDQSYYTENCFFFFFFILSGISITGFSYCWTYIIGERWPMFSSLDGGEGFSLASSWWENVQLSDIWLPGA